MKIQTAIAALLLASCATQPRATFTERHVYPCHNGVCEADDAALARTEGLRRRISGRALLCRAGTVDYENCKACMNSIREELMDAGLAPNAEDLFEPERRCW